MLEWMTMNKLVLQESGKTRGTGKRRRAKLIAANVWGTSAYYQDSVLERDAAEVVVPGIKMYENHQTYVEESERPEGDVSKLVGKVTSYGMYEPDNPEGPGIYADVEFYDSYVDRINEIGGDIGLSINGSGDYVEGEMDGRYGKIITKLVNIKSVDVVTAAGAGGKLVSILESARPTAGRPIETEGDQSVTALTKEQFDEGIAKLVESFNDTLGEGLTSLSTTLKEALVPEEPEVEKPEGKSTEGDEEKPKEQEQEPKEEEGEGEEVEIDHAELATKFAESGLPTAVMPSVVAALKEGKTIAEAIEAQTKLREAFEEQANVTSVRITEAQRKTGSSLRDNILSTFNS